MCYEYFDVKNPQSVKVNRDEVKKVQRSAKADKRVSIPSSAYPVFPTL